MRVGRRSLGEMMADPAFRKCLRELIELDRACSQSQIRDVREVVEGSDPDDAAAHQRSLIDAVLRLRNVKDKISR